MDVCYSTVFAQLQKFREHADDGPVLALSRDDVARDLATVGESSGEVRRVLRFAGDAG